MLTGPLDTLAKSRLSLVESDDRLTIFRTGIRFLQYAQWASGVLFTQSPASTRVLGHDGEPRSSPGEGSARASKLSILDIHLVARLYISRQSCCLPLMMP